MNDPINTDDRITVRVRSDQWNGQDFIPGPRVFTIAGVRDGKAEQQFDIDLVEGEGRVWRPPSTVLHLLIAVWGASRSSWVGRRVELYRDPSIAFGRDTVGGIRVSAVSHIDIPKTERIMVSRGKFQKFTVQPLPDAPTVDITPHIAALTAATSEAELRTAWQTAADAGLGKHPDIRDLTNQRKTELAQTQEADQ